MVWVDRVTVIILCRRRHLPGGRKQFAIAEPVWRNLLQSGQRQNGCIAGKQTLVAIDQPQPRSPGMKTKLSPRILVAALVLALGAGGTALAMSPEHCGAAGGRMEQRMGYHLQEMSRLHADLKLDARQEALWQDAEQFSRSSMRDRGDQMRKQRAEILASVSQPGADLRAVVKQMDELKDAGRQQHAASRERWLAVYDSLDAPQKEKARLFIKGKLEHMPQGVRFGRDAPARN